MTYFLFLALFVGIPIAILAIVLRLDNKGLPDNWQNMRLFNAMLIVIILALVYTTPWDNYLVATGVWWYDPDLVTGFTIGWVPIEEYTFFVVQPIMTGLWLVWLMRRWKPDQHPIGNSGSLRRSSSVLVGFLWVLSLIILFSGWEPGTYLGLEFGWALIPILIQVAFGADILWANRGLVLAGILPSTIYLSLADSVAIAEGTWTIAPNQSIELYLGGVLPIEEFFFFLLTNTLVVFGILLFTSRRSQLRIGELQNFLVQRGFLQTRPK